jgi:hypothetical protein
MDCRLSFLVVVFFAARYNIANNTGGSWTSRAKGTLRSIGSAELSYAAENTRHFYGSFKALQDTGDIAKGYRCSNMIENYSIEWRVSPTSVALTETIFEVNYHSAFTIVAWPDRGGKGLHTLAITEDQVVRIYNPKSKNDLHQIKTWDPIL